MIYILVHICLCLILFIVVFLYANTTPIKELKINHDWEFLKFKRILKQNYLIKKNTEFILIRLKFIDNRFLKNSIQIEPDFSQSSSPKLKVSGRTDLKPFGFVLFLILSFVFYIGVIYMYSVIKKARQRELKEMHVIANLCTMI